MDLLSDLARLQEESELFQIDAIRLSLAIDLFTSPRGYVSLASKYKRYHPQIQAIAIQIRTQWLESLIDQIKQSLATELDHLEGKTRWWLLVNPDLTILLDQLRFYRDYSTLDPSRQEVLDQLLGLEECTIAYPLSKSAPLDIFPTDIPYLYSMIMQPEWKVVGMQMCPTSKYSHYKRVYFLPGMPHPFLISGDVANNCYPETIIAPKNDPATDRGSQLI